MIEISACKTCESGEHDTNYIANIDHFLLKNGYIKCLNSSAPNVVVVVALEDFF